MQNQDIIRGFLNVDNTQPEFLKNFLEEVSIKFMNKLMLLKNL